MIGQKINNRYKITSQLGEGGMGEVYLAIDEKNNQQVAVKILARQLTANPEALERFKREGETLRQLDHPNIVKFIDAFEYEKQYVIVMEYVSGGNLQYIIKQGALPIEQARQITLDLCDALIRAHRLNIIHRDIKPENVLITENGTPKLADFGVAKLSESTSMTRSGTQVGTPYYMAPEAWEGKTLDAQADIWSLGVMLFEMLAGKVPFGGETGAAVMNKVLTTTPPNLRTLRNEVPAEMVRIVSRMLTRDKKRRYSTMREVAVNLERGQQVKASPNMRLLWIGISILFVFGALGLNNALQRLPAETISTSVSTEDTIMPEITSVSNVYDDFDKVIETNNLDYSRWDVYNDYGKPCSFSQKQGYLEITPSVPMTGCFLNKIPNQSIRRDELATWEMKVRVTSGFQGDCCGNVALVFGSDSFSDGGGWIACALHPSPDSNVAVFGLSRNGGKIEEYRSVRTATFDNWHVLRLTIDHDKFQFSCYIDNLLIGSVVPKDEAILRTAYFSQYIQIDWSSGITGAYHIDDVSIYR